MSSVDDRPLVASLIPLAAALALGAVLAPAVALAQDASTDASAGEVAPLQVHGFVSQGFIVTTHGNNYLAESDRGSFELAEVGINFTQSISERLRVGMQLFARDLGATGNYSTKADWFYLDYRWRDWLGVRAGRNKIPFGLYNDSSDADSSRVAVLLPQSVYPTENRDFLLAQTGVELYGYYGLGGAGALDYRLYGGTIFVTLPNQPASSVQIERLSIPYVVGGRLMWETPLTGLRLGGSVQALRLETDLFIPQPPPGAAVSVDVPGILWVASLEYAQDELVLAAEYSRWHLETQSNNQAIFADSKTTSERAYAMATYRLGELVQAGAYYSVFFPNTDDRSGREAQQHDVAGTVRIDLHEQWLLKLEAHYMNGTAVLSDALNDEPPAMLDRHWAVFLAKTTAYF